MVKYGQKKGPKAKKTQKEAKNGQKHGEMQLMAEKCTVLAEKNACIALHRPVSEPHLWPPK